MPSELFASLFESTVSTSITAGDFILCILASLLIGALLALVHAYKSKYSKSFVITLAMLPAVVCMVIMMVSGSIGAGIAVAGTFSLVRFRSVPGTAKEISGIFLAMASGLATGMGHIGFAMLFALIMAAATLFYNQSNFGNGKNNGLHKTLRITIPEDLDYTDVFDDLLETYTTENELISVKTTNMGSLYKLTYNITLHQAEKEKELIDKLRCRNGNLEISCSRQSSNNDEL